MLDATSFAAAGNQIKIYDYYTPKTGTASYYIDDYVKSEGPDHSIWPFVTQRYNWTPDGEHAFFGWLTNDEGMNGEESFVSATNGVGGLTFDQKTRTLSIPITVLNQSSPQFDFMYSDVHVRNLNTTTPDYVRAVDLKFSHLFTAFGITAQKSSGNNTVKLKSVNVKGLKNSNSASVSFTTTSSSAGSTAVYYEPTVDVVTAEQYVFSHNTALTLENTPLCVSSGSSTVDYFLMWPHEGETFGNAEITVVFDYNNQELVRRISLSSLNTEWLAGKKNCINLTFGEQKTIYVNIYILDWEENIEKTIDFGVNF